MCLECITRSISQQGFADDCCWITTKPGQWICLVTGNDQLSFEEGSEMGGSALRFDHKSSRKVATTEIRQDIV